MLRTRYVAAWSLLFMALFFIEYTSVLPRTRIPYDLAGFHYPLADYAFQSLKQGRFPQWDPTTYSGLSFVGNTQTAIFYPPMWLMFALKWGSAKLPYRALEYLALAHVWLAFLLCYTWLHHRRKLHWLASILGAGGYAFGGYSMVQLQHLGLMIAYAWLPLAFSAVDEAEQREDVRPLWKLALASAMCLLGGYPPIWVVFALCVGAFAFGRGGGLRLGLWTSAALASSLLLSAVALLPAMEAARPEDRGPEIRQGAGTRILNTTCPISSPTISSSILAPRRTPTRSASICTWAQSFWPASAAAVAEEIPGRGFAAGGIVSVAAVSGESGETPWTRNRAYLSRPGDHRLGFSRWSFRRSGSAGRSGPRLRTNASGRADAFLERAEMDSGRGHCASRGVVGSPDRSVEWARHGFRREIGMGRRSAGSCSAPDSFTCTRAPKVHFSPS